TQGSAVQDFLNQADLVERHLGMVFHRFLEGSRPRLRIRINGELVKPWDPFMTGHPSKPYNPPVFKHPTHPGDEAHSHVLPLEDPCSTRRPRPPHNPPVSKHPTRAGVEADRRVSPHPDRLTEEELETLAAPGGCTPQQGLYVYRNERLLAAGSWLGLGSGRS